MLISHRHPVARLVSLLTLVSVLACTTWKVDTRPIPELVADGGPSTIRVTLHDSTATVLREPSLRADTLTGRTTWGVLTIPLARVAYVETRKTGAGEVAGGVFGTLALTAFAVVIGIAIAGPNLIW